MSKNKHIFEPMVFRYLPNKANTTRLYGVNKAHKPENVRSLIVSMRIVVSTTATSPYGTSKH